jgi:hypothetical protein
MSRPSHQFFIAAALAALSQTALSANLGGLVKNEAGQGLPAVNLCLLPEDYVPGSNRDCLQQQASDGTGRYAFTNTQPGRYLIEVRDARFPNHVWKAPAPLAVVGAADVANHDLQQQFSFSNFKQELMVTAEHLPELQTFNLAAEPVFVKLYVAEASAPAGQKLLFLGRIGDLNNLSVKLSLPSPATEIRYEIYSPSQSVGGAIPLGA